MIDVGYFDGLHRSSKWYKDHVFKVKDDSIPSFKDWLASHGGDLYNLRSDISKRGDGWRVKFEDEELYVMFLLKYC